MQHYLVHCVIVLCFTTAMAFGGFASRLKRAIHDKTATLIPCASAFMKCDENYRCSTAINKLAQRCKVTADRCNANMKDLPRCGQIMDHLFVYGLPEEGCKCSDEDLECIRKQKRIYGNRCFDAIRHLRERGLFPKKLDAYDKVTKPQTTTVVTSSGVSEIHRSAILDNDVQSLKIGKSVAWPHNVYGDKESETSSMSMTTVMPLPAQKIEDSSVKMVISKATPDNNIMKLVKPHDGDNVANTNVERVVRGHSKSPSAMNNRFHDRLKLNAVQSKVSMELDIRKKLEKGLINTDYKSIAIILGILLAIVVLSSLIVFLWTRTSNAVFYKGSKFMKDRRMDDEVYSAIQFLSPTSNKS